jgi:hypothetical protein
MNGVARQQDLWDRTWKDRRGRVVIWQTPNAWLIGWAVLTVVSLLLNGTLSMILSWTATGVLGIWSFLEVTKGVNYFRRALGLAVLLFVLASILKGLK